MLLEQLPSPNRPRSALDRRGCILLLFLTLSLVPRTARAQSGSQYPRTDVQGWVDLEGTHALRENVDLNLNGGLRLSNDAGHLVYRRVAGGLVFKVNHYLTLSPYYCFYYTDSSRVSESRENRIAFAATVGAARGRWKILDRNLIEKRFLPGGQPWRYRNRLELARDIELAHSALRFFVWDEVYYDSFVSAWARNRAAIGAGKRISSRLGLDLYYVRQNDSHVRPGDLSAIAMTIRTHF
jgi:Protein of unknown function (DUF2490)